MGSLNGGDDQSGCLDLEARCARLQTNFCCVFQGFSEGERECVCAWMILLISVGCSNRFCFILDDRTNSFMFTLSILNALDKDSVIIKDLTDKATHLREYGRM